MLYQDEWIIVLFINFSVLTACVDRLGDSKEQVYINYLGMGCKTVLINHWKSRLIFIPSCHFSGTISTFGQIVSTSKCTAWNLYIFFRKNWNVETVWSRSILSACACVLFSMLICVYCLYQDFIVKVSISGSWTSSAIVTEVNDASIHATGEIVLLLKGLLKYIRQAGSLY